MILSPRTIALVASTLRSAGLCFFYLAVLIGAAVPTQLRAGELHDATRDGDVAAVTALLAGGAEVDESDYLLGTALHIAVSAGNTAIAEVLIAHGADVNAPSEDKGSRPLHLAALIGDAAMLALLLDHGADIEGRDALQRTPLHRASATGDSAVVGLLLDGGADVHAKSGEYDGTPLHYACFNGRIEAVRLLLDDGADINAANYGGRTALRVAATATSYSNVGDASLLELLVSKGADLNAEDTSGQTALAYAEHQASAGQLLYQEIVANLRRLGATK